MINLQRPAPGNTVAPSVKGRYGCRPIVEVVEQTGRVSHLARRYRGQPQAAVTGDTLFLRLVLLGLVLATILTGGMTAALTMQMPLMRWLGAWF